MLDDDCTSYFLLYTSYFLLLLYPRRDSNPTTCGLKIRCSTIWATRVSSELQAGLEPTTSSLLVNRSTCYELLKHNGGDWWDLNPRLPDSQSGALPAELQTPCVFAEVKGLEPLGHIGPPVFKTGALNSFCQTSKCCDSWETRTPSLGVRTALL